MESNSGMRHLSDFFFEETHGMWYVIDIFFFPYNKKSIIVLLGPLGTRKNERVEVVYPWSFGANTAKITRESCKDVLLKHWKH